MSELEVERAHLAKAEQDITAGERRVTAQALLVDRLRTDGLAADHAELLLLTLQQSLQTWRDHRDLILQAIERLEHATPRAH